MAPIDNMDMVIHDPALHASWQTPDPLVSLDVDLSDVQLILLNGPPRSGKNTLAGLLDDALPAATPRVIMGYSDHLKILTHTFYGLPTDTPVDHFDSCKDVPSDQFLGLTPRQAYIFMNEKVIKPLHGDLFLGYMFVRKVANIVQERRSPLVVICPDSGFYGESLPLLTRLSPGAARLARLHKEGCTYEGDSRGYVSYADRPELGVREYDIDNPKGNPGAMLDVFPVGLLEAA